MTSKPPSSEELSSPILPFRQVDQEHLAFVHDPPDAQVLLGRGQYPVEQGIGEECADLVLDRRRAVRPVAERELVEFLQQERADGLVAERLRDAPSELLVGEDAQHVVERRVRLLQERHEHVAQDVLHAHAPRVRPHLLEDIHHAGSGERDPILPDMAQRIVAVRLARIGGVQIDDVIPPRCEECVPQCARQDRRADRSAQSRCRAPGLGAPCFQERRFARAGLADDVDVQKAVFVLDAEDALVVAKINAGKARDMTCIHIRAHRPSVRCTHEARSYAEKRHPHLDQSACLVSRVVIGLLVRLRC